MSHDPIQWHCHVVRERRDGDIDEYRVRFGKDEGERRFFEDYPVTARDEVDGNILLTAGATALWTKLTGGAGTVFDNTNAYTAVGDSTTAAASGQTDLQAATNKARQAMDATYPQVSSNNVTFRSTFGAGAANFAWNEWGIANASSGGTLLNRRVESLGTKSGGSWTLTTTLSLS